MLDLAWNLQLPPRFRSHYFQQLRLSFIIILKLSLKPENIKDVKDVEKMFELITSLFQSMTTQGFTTFEIVRYIANELNKFSDDDRKNIISFLEESYTIVHSNYKGKLTKKIAMAPPFDIFLFSTFSISDEPVTPI